jgi:hypothetical protein
MLGDNITAVEATCPTGNCTWPITPSLAICGGCAPSTYDLQCGEDYCNYTMPSGSLITLNNTPRLDEGVGFVVSPSTGARWDSKRNDTLYIANFDVVGAPYRALAVQFDPSKAQASECAIWFCIQAYEIFTVAGHQSQNIVHTFSKIDATPFDGSSFDNYTFPVLPADVDLSPSVQYNVSLSGFLSYRSSLSELCNGTAYLDSSASTADSDTVEAIWSASADLNPWMQQVVLSMSNGLRTWGQQAGMGLPPQASPQVPTPQYRQYDGTGYQLVVRVRWPWIILPTAMVVFSIILLISVMVRTARSPLAAWKGSPLALLLFDVGPGIKEKAMGQTHVCNGIEKSVKNIKVVLEGRPGGLWTFKTA